MGIRPRSTSKVRNTHCLDVDGADEMRLDTPKQWSYRGEGNCNLVVGLPQSRQILRLRKTEKPQSLLGWILVLLADLLQWCSGRSYADERRDLEFYKQVMRPLIGAEYTAEARMVALSRQQLELIKAGVGVRRPDFRQHKTLQLGRAALFSDFAFLPPRFDHLDLVGDTFAVELKPKQGWRPPEERQHPHCLYCMHQFLKLEKGRIQARTRYCPEELFSGTPARMRAALKNLLEAPQNNLKIFRNGELRFDDRRRSTAILQELFQSQAAPQELIDEFCHLLQRCLVKDLAPNGAQCPSCPPVSHLPSGSVLGRILAVQQLDREGTHATYKKLCEGEEFDYVEKLLGALANRAPACRKCALLAQAELPFAPYLVAAVAKDCSLMVTVRRLRQAPSERALQERTMHTRFGPFLVNIGVFDLYPKPLATIHKHQQRNRDIVRAFHLSPTR